MLTFTNNLNLFGYVQGKRGLKEEQISRLKSFIIQVKSDVLKIHWFVTGLIMNKEFSTAIHIHRRQKVKRFSYSILTIGKPLFWLRACQRSPRNYFVTFISKQSLWCLPNLKHITSCLTWNDTIVSNHIIRFRKR